MLSFDDDFTAAAPKPIPPAPETIRPHVAGGISWHLAWHPVQLAAQLASRPRRRAAGDAERLSPRAGRGQARHQRPGGCQPARAVQVSLGLGQIPGRLRQPLDAAGDQHAARHRAVEESRRADRRRAPDRQAQPRLLRHCRQPCRQQHLFSARIRHMLGARMPASICCVRRSRRRSTPTRISTMRIVESPGASTRAEDLQRLSRKD